MAVAAVAVAAVGVVVTVTLCREFLIQDVLGQNWVLDRPGCFGSGTFGFAGNAFLGLVYFPPRLEAGCPLYMRDDA